MSKPAYLTPEGAQKLRAELEELKGPRREDIATRLRIAIEQGDLSENADYIRTKEEQGFLEGRILEVAAILRNAVIIEDSHGNNGEVVVGSHVTIQEEDFPEETYHLVGANEANPREGRISNESPIGKALLNKKVGDEVEVQVPNGKIHLKIVKIA